MRKSILFILAILCSVVVAGAQEKRGPFEVALGFGGPNRPIGAAATEPGVDPSYGTATLDLFYTPVKWVSVGVGVGIHDFIKKPNSLPGTSPNLMFYLRGNWYTGRKFRVYSLVGYPEIPLKKLGDYYGFSWRTFQISPLGISYGGRVYGFAEIGTGYMYTPGRFGIGMRF